MRSIKPRPATLSNFKRLIIAGLCAQGLIPLLTLPEAGLSKSHPVKPAQKRQEIRRLEFLIDNASCLTCIRNIEATLAKMPGVKSAKLSLKSPVRAVVYYDKNTGKVTSLIQKVKSGGYGVSNIADYPADQLPKQPISRQQEVRHPLNGTSAEDAPKIRLE